MPQVYTVKTKILIRVVFYIKDRRYKESISDTARTVPAPRGPRRCLKTNALILHIFAARLKIVAATNS